MKNSLCINFNQRIVINSIVLTLLTFSSVVVAQPQTATLVGNTPAEFDVTYGGAASYKVPLAVPTGAAGLRPKISLNYNSQFGNGVMGLGWQLSASLARIEECYKKNTNQKILCLNGDELISQGSSYYRTEIDSGVLVEQLNSTTYQLYFENGDSKTLTRRLTSPNVFLEAGHSQRGGAGYSVNWSVDSTNRESLVTSITYQGNEIEFNYEPRTDIRRGYWMGAARNRIQRLQSIVARADGEDYRQYDVFYDYDSVSGISKVTDIQECTGSDGCLEALSFGWTDSGARGFSNTRTRRSHSTYEMVNFDNNGRDDYITSPKLVDNYDYTVLKSYGDINGDGRDDIINLVRTYSGKDNQNKNFSINYDLNGGGSANANISSSNMLEKILYVEDMNGDGRDGIVYQATSLRFYVWSLSPSGAGTVANIPAPEAYDPEWGTPIVCHDLYLTEANGDNLKDILFFTTHSESCPSTMLIHQNKGSLEFEQLSSEAGVSNCFLQDIEAGEKMASMVTIFKLSKALGVTPDKIMLPVWKKWLKES